MIEDDLNSIISEAEFALNLDSTDLYRKGRLLVMLELLQNQ
jgi:hypothetical protein